MEPLQDKPVSRIILDLHEEPTNKIDVWKTRIIKKDGSHPSKAEVVIFALGLLDLYMDIMSEKKVGEEIFLAVVTEKDGENTEIKEIVLEDFRIARIIV